MSRNGQEQADHVSRELNQIYRELGELIASVNSGQHIGGYGNFIFGSVKERINLLVNKLQLVQPPAVPAPG